jgi:hypothetical protein
VHVVTGEVNESLDAPGRALPRHNINHPDCHDKSSSSHTKGKLEVIVRQVANQPSIPTAEQLVVLIFGFHAAVLVVDGEEGHEFVCFPLGGFVSIFYGH